MNLPSNIQQAITSAGETVSSKAAEFINMKSTPMVDYAGNFAKALPSVFIGIVVILSVIVFYGFGKQNSYVDCAGRVQS